jgi:exopolysaccharide production protein ExoZ
MEAAGETAGRKPASKILYGIQALRGVAALLVVFRHAAKTVTNDGPNAFPVGQFGVDIFFVISGVVIYLTGRNLTAPQFLARRLIRIVPLYWLILCVAIAGDVVRGKDNPNLLVNAILSFLFIPSRGENGAVFPPITVGWSLNFEMFFYLICAGILLTLGGKRLLSGTSAVILAVVAIGFALYDVLPWPEYPVMILFLPLILEFLAGMWLAHFSRTRGVGMPLMVSVILLLGSCVWVAISPTSEPYERWRFLTWGIPAVAIVWAVLCAESQVHFEKWKPALALGDASYALYLVHMIVLAIGWAILGKLGLTDSIGIAYVLLVIGSVIAGLAAHMIVEKPMLKLIRRMTGAGKAPSVAES